MAIKLANGTTITFATSSLSAEKLNVTGSGNYAVEDIPSSHLGTVGAMTFEPADLYNGGEFSSEIHWTGDVDPLTHLKIVQVITIDWGGTGKTSAFLGYINEWPINATLHEKMTAVIKIKVADDITAVIV